VSVVDLPPGIGLVGTPLGTFGSPLRARALAVSALVVSIALGVATWYLISKHPYRHGAPYQFTLPVAFTAFSLLGIVVRSARVTVTRDGVRWGWLVFGFHQPAARIEKVHVYADGVALEARRGSWWFIAARDWDRFDALVRQLRRADLPLRDHPGRAPLRARLQSYGRFLDLLLLGSVVGAVVVMLWAV